MPGCAGDKEAWVIRSSRAGMVSRRILITVAAALIPLVAGCEAGINAPSLSWHQPTDGTGKIVGTITISNAFVLGAPVGAFLRPGQNAGIFLGLTNTGSRDRLLAIKAPGVASSVTLPGGTLPLVRNHTLLLTGPRPVVILQKLSRPLRGGSVITLFLIFAKAGVVELQVPVMPRVEAYATLLPAPTPSPTSSPSPGHHGKGHGATATASPSPSPSGT
jgi:copper(I)-binding protein